MVAAAVPGPSSTGPQGSAEDGLRTVAATIGALSRDIETVVPMRTPLPLRVHAPVMIVLALSGCSDAGARDVSSTASTAPAQPSADAVKPSASHDAGPYCREAKAGAGQSGVAIGRALAGPTPADVKAGIDAMVTHSERLAALAPPELREEYRVLLEEWRHTREAVERAGWSREEAGRQIESGLQNEKHLQAIGEIAGYWSTHCE